MLNTKPNIKDTPCDCATFTGMRDCHCTKCGGYFKQGDTNCVYCWKEHYKDPEDPQVNNFRELTPLGEELAEIRRRLDKIEGFLNLN